MVFLKPQMEPSSSSKSYKNIQNITAHKMASYKHNVDQKKKRALTKIKHIA